MLSISSVDRKIIGRWLDVRDRCPSLAYALAVYRGIGVANETDDGFRQECGKPYNRRFHALPHCNGVVVETDGAVDDFRRCLRDSPRSPLNNDDGNNAAATAVDFLIVGVDAGG